MFPPRRPELLLRGRPGRLKSFLTVLTRVGSSAIGDTHPLSQTSVSLAIHKGPRPKHLPHPQAPGHTPEHFCLVLLVTGPWVHRVVNSSSWGSQGYSVQQRGWKRGPNQDQGPGLVGWTMRRVLKSPWQPLWDHPSTACQPPAGSPSSGRPSVDLLLGLSE